MNDEVIEFGRAGYVVTTNRVRIPLDQALGLLRSAYWAANLTGETLARAMENSLCFGLLRADRLIGIARVVTDRATYAYLTDVVLAPELRGQGLGRWLMQCVLEHPDLQDLRRFTLLTGDAAALYEEFGFTSGAGGLVYMELRGGAKARRAPGQ